MKIEIKQIKPTVGIMSLVGIHFKEGEPASWGNYFTTKCGIRIINFWAENFDRVDKLFLHGEPVVVHVFTDTTPLGKTLQWGIVADDRIPKRWYTHKLCCTGYYSVTPDVAMHIYYPPFHQPIWLHPDFHYNDVREWTDHDAYFTEKGWVIKNGMMSKKVEAKSVPARAGWTIETAPDLKAYHGKEAGDNTRKKD